MARKTVKVTIKDEGRDNGKMFKITEMPAYKAEKWAVRVLNAIALEEIPDLDPDSGMAGIAMAGLAIFASANIEKLEPLLDEMMGCVEIEMSADVVRPVDVENDIEEVKTFITLRKAVLELHTGFFMAVGL